MKNKVLIATIAAVGLVAGWAVFRPELLFVNKTVNETFPVTGTSAQSSSPVAISAGNFRGIAHETKGMATVFQLPEGKKILRLTNFETSNGPNVHVYLVGANDAKDNATVAKAGFIDLGSIKGNKGDQNYDLPADVDLNKYRAVTIWCARFNVNFGTAPLNLADSKPSQPVVVTSGSFRGIAHKTDGMAAVYALPDGKQVLRLTNFETSNGPNVHVYLVAAEDARDNASVTKAGFIDLGSIKGNKGDQNYDIPAGTDLGKYRAVTIWCARFNVNFGTAALSKQG